MSDDTPRKRTPKQPRKRITPARKASRSATPTPSAKAKKPRETMAVRRLRAAAIEPKAPAPAVEVPTADASPVDTPAPRTTRRARLYRIPVLGAIVYLIAPPRTKPSILRRAISGTSAIVALLGLAMFLYPVAGTHYPGIIRVPVEKGIEWSNVISDLESNRIQNRLEARFERTLAAAPTTPVAEGDPLTRITMPKLGVDAIVVEGTSPSALKAGAGHYPQTPLPGKPGNVGIAGHRTTFGRPFNRVDELRTGDKIILTTPVGVYTYELTRNPWITHPADWSVIDQTPEATLTLTSCHPKGSANQRIIVRAKLVKSEVRRAAKAA